VPSPSGQYAEDDHEKQDHGHTDDADDEADGEADQPQDEAATENQRQDEDDEKDFDGFSPEMRRAAGTD
jgi:hypothetical protein